MDIGVHKALQQAILIVVRLDIEAEEKAYLQLSEHVVLVTLGNIAISRDSVLLYSHLVLQDISARLVLKCPLQEALKTVSLQGSVAPVLQAIIVNKARLMESTVPLELTCHILELDQLKTAFQYLLENSVLKQA